MSNEQTGGVKYWLGRGAREAGIFLSEDQLERFERYYLLILKRNKELNLTGFTDEKEVAIKHFLDSLTCVLVEQFVQNARVMDIGSGAGLPGIPLKIFYPGIYLTLVDSVQKKVDFLKEAVSVLGLSGVEVALGRAEELAHRSEYRGLFDYVLCRAVASLQVVLEYSLAFLRPGGLMIAFKGPAAVEEERASVRALELLGGKIRSVRELDLPFLGHKRRIVVVEKVGSTPDKYPRRAGVPRKRPL